MATSRPLNLTHTFDKEAHAFLQPSQLLHTAFLELAKTYLDPIASEVTDLQIARQKHERETRKRKRRASDLDGEKKDLLRMKRVHVNGFDVQQVWQQAKRVLGAAADELENEFANIAVHGELDDISDDEQEGGRSKGVKKVHFASDDESLVEYPEDESLGEEGVDWEYDGDDGDDVSDREGTGGVGLLSKVNGAELDHSDLESLDIGDETPASEVSDLEATQPLIVDKHGLNDGFFSIDQFNKQSQFLEQVDARGDSDDGAASDEEDIDWSTNPLDSNLHAQAPTKARPSKKVSKEADEELEEESNESEDDEDGPTFGNIDLDAPEGASDVEGEFDDEDMMEDGGSSNTNDITYKAFFAPPARKASKKQKLHKSRLKTLGKDIDSSVLATEPGAANQEDAALERTISNVHHDLFEDELSDDPAETDADHDPKNSNLSSHERRQLDLRQEIRRLEAASVAAKPWSLTGETLAPARPLNSLLEEDLDFERAGKPIPVITEEVSEDIEALIKRRIVARDFDEVIRRRPNDLIPGGSSAETRRGTMNISISDAKPQKGLAEEYADDHLRATDPGYFDTRSAALTAAHNTITTHWAAVSAQLDALCNWHYKPKPPAPNLEVRVDVPSISLEDARPTAAEGEIGAEALLAPQEVWHKGMDSKREGEVVTKGGGVVAKEEESREQKQRHRRREKERGKKAGGNTNGAPSSGGGGRNGSSGGKTGKRADEANVVGQLKKGGVKIIDKKGALRNVDGAAVADLTSGRGGAGNLKL